MSSTVAPIDLSALRNTIISLTNLSGDAVGIVGDSAHIASGGYHEGKTDIVNAGLWYSDYSVRLIRDRNGCTESASAMDIGYQWPTGGNPAWLKFNNALVTALHANVAPLAAIRAVNYTPDGSTKLRTDRETGWSVVSSSDTVDIHTHIEWYRDTEGQTTRGDSINWIYDTIKSILTGGQDMTPEEHDRLVNIDQTCNALIRLDPQAQLTTGNQANILAQTLEAIETAVKTGTPITLDSATATAVGASMAANIDYGKLATSIAEHFTVH